MSFRRFAVAIFVLAGFIIFFGSASADHTAGTVYTGTHSRGGEVKITVSTDGKTVNLEAENLGLASPCPPRFKYTEVPVTNHGFTIVGRFADAVSMVLLRGAFGPSEVSGTLIYSTPNCTFTLAWSARIPGTPDRLIIESQLGACLVQTDAVWSYNQGQWLGYRPGIPSAAQDLKAILPGIGYWVYLAADCSMNVGGIMVPIAKGWNLIGF